MNPVNALVKSRISIPFLRGMLLCSAPLCSYLSPVVRRVMPSMHSYAPLSLRTTLLTLFIILSTSPLLRKPIFQPEMLTGPGH